MVLALLGMMAAMLNAIQYDLIEDDDIMLESG